MTTQGISAGTAETRSGSGPKDREPGAEGMRPTPIGTGELLASPEREAIARVYIAARFSRRPEANQLGHLLQARGCEITSRWTKPDCDHVLPTGLSRQAEDHERQRFALEDLDDVRAASWTISLMEEPRSNTRGGRHIEFGLALALGHRLTIIGPRETVFHHLPQVEHFDTVAAFVASLPSHIKASDLSLQAPGAGSGAGGPVKTNANCHGEPMPTDPEEAKGWRANWNGIGLGERPRRGERSEGWVRGHKARSSWIVAGRQHPDAPTPIEGGEAEGVIQKLRERAEDYRYSNQIDEPWMVLKQSEFEVILAALAPSGDDLREGRERADANWMTADYFAALLDQHGIAYEWPDREPSVGCVLVPREPTEAMLKAWVKADGDAWDGGGRDSFSSSDEARLIWSAMLAAAPKAPPLNDIGLREAEALGYAKAEAWYKYGIAWLHLEQVSRDELLAAALESLPAGSK